MRARLVNSSRAFLLFWKTYLRKIAANFALGYVRVVVVMRGEHRPPTFAEAKGGENVKSNPHEEHKQHAFDSFCKKVLKHEARDYYKEVQRRSAKVITFSELSAQELERLFILDEYPAEHHIFNVSGYDVGIKSELLAAALAALPDRKRDIILLYHFLGLTDQEIGNLLHMLRATVQYQRTSTLQLLKEIMEEKINE